MTLSKETIGKLADAITLEVIDYIVNNPKTNTFLYEMVNEALCEKLGNKNEDGSCSFDGSLLAPAVLENITLTLAPSSMPRPCCLVTIILLSHSLVALLP